MKKLLTAIAAAAVAVGVQASTVDWSYTISDAVGDATAANSLTAYLFTAAAWNTLQTEGINAQSDIAGAALDSSSFGIAGSTGKNTKTYTFSTSNANGDIGAKRPVSNDQWGSTVDMVIVIFDSSKPNGGAFQTTAVTMSTHGSADGANESGASTTTLASLSGGTWTPVGVPEPTTVALLAVGLAALGLKRKVA